MACGFCGMKVGYPGTPWDLAVDGAVAGIFMNGDHVVVCTVGSGRSGRSVGPVCCRTARSGRMIGQLKGARQVKRMQGEADAKGTADESVYGHLLKLSLPASLPAALVPCPGCAGYHLAVIYVI
jgi:hypothetical protein